MLNDDHSRAEPPFPAIMIAEPTVESLTPLSVLVTVAQIEDMMARLAEAMNPVVAFSEDLRQMRRDVSEYRNNRIGRVVTQLNRLCQWPADQPPTTRSTSG